MGQAKHLYILLGLCLVTNSLIGCSSNSLKDAVKNGDLNEVRTLTRQDPNLANERVRGGWPSDQSILQYAIEIKKSDIAYYLVSVNADVNAKDSIGRTALHYAVKNGDTKIVKQLLRNHANVLAADNTGDTPLIYAMDKHDLQMVLLLQKHGATGVLLLHQAAAFGDVSTVRNIIQNNPEQITEQDDRGNTALHFAAEWGHIDIVALLLKSGIDPNTHNKSSDQTALHLASEKGNLKIVQLLLDSGADANITANKKG